MIELLQAEQAGEMILPDSVQKARLSETIDKISSIDIHTLATNLAQEACWIGLKILLAIIIYFVGKWVIKWVVRLMNRSFERHNTDQSLRSFLISVVKTVLVIVILLIVVQTIGINTSSFIALFASAGLAIGMALSGTLQNFAGGVMVLVLRPYEVGDFISANGKAGTVEAIGLFSTRVITVDNKVIFIPNNTISSAIIENYSRKDVRRVDITFSVASGTDVAEVRRIYLAMFEGDKEVLSAPASPELYIESIAGDGIQMTGKLWCETAKYWDVYYRYVTRLCNDLPKAGIGFARPVINVNAK